MVGGGSIELEDDLSVLTRIKELRSWPDVIMFGSDMEFYEGNQLYSNQVILGADLRRT